MTDTQFEVDLKELLEAGCHFGHQSRRWNPKMAKYIYATRDKVHIFDLAKTAKKLSEAMQYAYELGKTGKVLVFVGTKRQAQAIIKEEAGNIKAPFMSTRWIGGSVTNWEEIKKRIDKLHEMRQKKEAGEYSKYTKKENVLIDREIERLDRLFGGISDLDKIPDAIFIVDIHKEVAAVKEAKVKDLPIIAMVDSNSDPDLADYVIPVNDDAVRSIKLIVSKIAQAYAEGKAKVQKEAPKDVAKNPGKKETKSKK